MLIEQEVADKLRADSILDENVPGNTLMISLPSMSLDAPMRFKLHRAMVGDSEGWAASGSNANIAP